MGSRIGRNDPCPCGSGRKFKRCCIDTWAATAEVAEELFSLGAMFPLLRPRGDAFERWLSENATAGLSQELVNDALAILPGEEVARIEGGHALEFPGVWRTLVDDFRDEELARQLVVIGAIAAALAEPRELDHEALATIEAEDGLAADPVEALAMVVDGCALWSIAEVSFAWEALEAVSTPRWAEVLTAEAGRLWTDAHAERLDLLVGRVRALSAPAPEFPRAWAALATACELYARESGARESLAALLLEQALFANELDLLAAA
jgi:hypothetical protein